MSKTLDSDKPLHPSTSRLFKAARDLKGLERASDLAKLLGVDQQTLKHWETRGIPAKKTQSVSRQIGCVREWLETGEGNMAVEAPPWPFRDITSEHWFSLREDDRIFAERQLMEILTRALNSRRDFEEAATRATSARKSAA